MDCGARSGAGAARINTAAQPFESPVMTARRPRRASLLDLITPQSRTAGRNGFVFAKIMIADCRPPQRKLDSNETGSKDRQFASLPLGLWSLHFSGVYSHKLFSTFSINFYILQVGIRHLHIPFLYQCSFVGFEYAFFFINFSSFHCLEVFLLVLQSIPTQVSLVKLIS